MSPNVSCIDGREKAEALADTVISTMELITSQVKETAHAAPKQEIESMLTLLRICKENGNSVFVAGAGRSGLMGRAFAMRLMHLGFKAYVVGETVTPAIRARDVLIAISGSGSTKSVVIAAEKCKEVGAFIVALTSKAESVLGGLSSVNVVLPSKSNADKIDADKIDAASCGNSAQMLMGTGFEISTLVFADALVLHLASIINVKESEMKERHANTE
jgi:6-phospho 3-hexuloisomerase